MATRSNIAVQQEDGSFSYIYVHWDGYPEGVGQTLLDHYTDVAKARELMALGDLSILGDEIGEKHDFDEPHHEWAVKVKTPEALARAALVDTWCLAYGRDRGETNIEARTIPADGNVLSAHEEQYLYVMKHDDAGVYTWFVDHRGELKPLAEMIDAGEDDED